MKCVCGKNFKRERRPGRPDDYCSDDCRKTVRAKQRADYNRRNTKSLGRKGKRGPTRPKEMNQDPNFENAIYS
jgi:hypothetical protein